MIMENLMKAILILFASSLIALSGCVTMPDPVPDEYMVDKTADQQKTLEKLENFVIAKNHAARVMKDKLQEAEQKLKIDKGRLEILKDEKSLLEDKQKQYKLENDGARIDENAKAMAEKDSEIRAQVARLDNTSAVLDLANADKDVADADLSVQVAELRYERARIARDYLVKRLGAADPNVKKDSSESPDMYDEKYRKYLEKQREILADKKVARDEAAVKVKITEDKLIK
jgi:hypothetical protein